MPKKQINVVNLSDVKPIDETTEIQQPENDERTQIKQAIEMAEQQQQEENTKPKRKTPTKKTSVEKQPEPTTEPTPETVEIAIEETKPKRKTPTKKTKVDKPPEIVAPVEDSPKESTPKQKPDKKMKTLEMFKCDKCNKEMTANALRYTHPKYCTGREIIREEVPVKRQKKTTNNY